MSINNVRIISSAFAFSFISILFNCIGTPLHGRGVPPACKWGFLINEGQWDSTTFFRSTGSGFSLSFKKDRVCFTSSREEEEYHAKIKEVSTGDHFAGDDDEEENEVREYIVWSMNFTGANPEITIAPGKELAARTNFFKGRDPAKWRTKVPEYRTVTYRNVWEGIDIRFSLGPNGELKYDFLLAAGADPDHIQIDFEGLDYLRLKKDGSLGIGHPWSEVVESPPIAFFTNEDLQIDVQFVLSDSFSYQFKVNDPIPKDKAWVIDPYIQVWSSYANPTWAQTFSYVNDVDYDEAGHLYIIGRADSSFPSIPGSYQVTHGGGLIDAYVAKFTSDGSNLLYMTFLGGGDNDRGNTIDVSDDGVATVGGESRSNDFPTTAGALFEVNPVFINPWVARLDPSGSNLIYSTYACNNCRGVTMDLVGVDNDEVIATGTSYASDPFVATPGAFETTHPGLVSAWVCRINATGTSMVWGTHLGGVSSDTPYGIDANDLGEPYVVGRSSGPGFPTTPNSFQPNALFGGAPFITRLTVDGTGLIYSSYLGEGGGNFLNDIAVHPVTREAFVCGSQNEIPTSSTPGVLQPVHGGAVDATVARISADGSQLIYLTFIGGQYADEAFGIDINIDGEAYVSGTSSYNGPIDPPCQLQDSTFGGTYFLAHISPQGDELLCGEYALFGGDGHDYNIPRVKVRDDGFRDTLFCSVTSHSTNFPTTPGAFQETNPNGWGDCPTAFKLVVTCLESSSDINLCSIDSLRLDAPPQVTDILWSNNDTTSSIWVDQSGVYVLNALLFGCPFTDTFTVSSADIQVDLGPDTLLCDPGGLVELTAPSGYPSYLWSSGDTTLVTSAQPGLNWLEVQDSSGCVGRDSIVLALGMAAGIDLGPDSLLCDPNDLVELTAPSGYTSYLWSSGDTSIVTNAQLGLNWLEIQDSSGCVGRDSMILALGVAGGIDLGPDSLLCDPNGLLELSVLPGYSSYLWSSGDTSLVTTAQPGLNWLEVQDSSGCMARDSMIVIIGTPAEVDLGPDRKFCWNDVPILSIPELPDASPLWSNGDIGWSTEVFTSGTYWLAVTNECGSVYDSVEVNFITDAAPVFFPNTFSPNGDGINDCYRIDTKSEEAFHLQIFDRWGRIVFETRNINECWDGDFAGRPVPEGVYYGTVKLRDCLGKLVTVVETITLVR